MVVYPSVDKVVEFNALSLSVISVKKSDAAKVLSVSKVEGAIEACRKSEGGLFDKAVVLLRELVQAHAFASGNRRTAFIATKYFLVMNNKRLGVKDSEENAKVLLGIRERFYSDEEIKEWLQNGKIREFKR